MSLSGVVLLEEGCSESCHDELYVDVFVDLSGSRGSACDVTFASGADRIVYQCPPASEACGTQPKKTPCTPLGDAPPVAMCECSPCGMSMTTQSNGEGDSLRNALGGSLHFSIEATCGGTAVYSADAGTIQTQKCN